MTLPVEPGLHIKVGEQWEHFKGLVTHSPQEPHYPLHEGPPAPTHIHVVAKGLEECKALPALKNAHEHREVIELSYVFQSEMRATYKAVTLSQPREIEKAASSDPECLVYEFMLEQFEPFYWTHIEVGDLLSKV